MRRSSLPGDDVVGGDDLARNGDDGDRVPDLVEVRAEVHAFDRQPDAALEGTGQRVDLGEETQQVNSAPVVVCD